LRPSEVPHAVAALVELGQILGRHADAGGTTRGITVAEAALAAAHSYQPGQAAARYPRGHGRHVEPVRWPDGTIEVVDVPGHDPTGETAIAHDPTTDLADQWLTALHDLDLATARVRRLIDVLLPPQPGTQPAQCDTCGAPTHQPRRRDRRATGLDVAIDGWCRSCYRDDQRLTPIDTDRRGHRRYHDVCAWCGRFRAEHKQLPPVTVIRYRHVHGGRVPTSIVDQALAEARRSKRDRSTQKRRKAG
jgi:hypothetical protein